MYACLCSSSKSCMLTAACLCIFVSSKSIQQQHVADLFRQGQIHEHGHIYQHAKTFLRVFMIEMFFIFTCSQRRLLFLYSLKVDYLKYLPANIVASHTHYDKEGNSYSMGTCIAEKGKTKYVLFKVPGGSKYAVIISVSWCTLLFLIVRNLFKLELHD